MTPVSAEAKASAQLLANLMKLLQSSPPSLIQHLSQQAISWLLSAIRLDVFLWGCMRLHGDTVTDRARLQRVLQRQATTQQQRFWRKCHVRASSQECLHETAQLQKSFLPLFTESDGQNGVGFMWTSCVILSRNGGRGKDREEADCLWLGLRWDIRLWTSSLASGSESNTWAHMRPIYRLSRS